MADTQYTIDSLEELKSRLETENDKLKRENSEILTRIIKLEQIWAEKETKKNRKFQTKCIQIIKEILNEEPIIEYRPPFLNGLEFDAFFQKYKIVLEVQGSQHRFHSTSWYKDVKKLEDIVNRDRKKRCICQDNGIFLLEVCARHLSGVKAENIMGRYVCTKWNRDNNVNSPANRINGTNSAKKWQW
ncbi:hypothetical protein Glove_135g83 [Diversispora epigaea]|uniref:DUF559 domain-containing protein n=1 Tax=Diversispora epigaea TaxID=1348612 RepID=A0A397IWR8_9GLOM|nr:hypothetical protein Glove_135g83 [Diversispora epigaea]